MTRATQTPSATPQVAPACPVVIPGITLPGRGLRLSACLSGTVTGRGPETVSNKITNQTLATLPAQDHQACTGTSDPIASHSRTGSQTPSVTSRNGHFPSYREASPVMQTQTPYQLNRDLLAQTGASHLIRLKPGDQVKAVVGDRVVILTYKALIQSDGTEKRTHEGMRLVCITDGRVVSDETIWSELPEPIVTLAHRDERNTPAEYRARALREQECYRPGMDSRLGQRDSSARECQGYWKG